MIAKTSGANKANFWPRMTNFENQKHKGRKEKGGRGVLNNLRLTKTEKTRGSVNKQ